MAGLYQACLIPGNPSCIEMYTSNTHQRIQLQTHEMDESKWDQTGTRGAVKQNMVLETNIHYRNWSSTVLRSCLMHLGHVGNCSWYSV